MEMLKKQFYICPQDERVRVDFCTSTYSTRGTGAAWVQVDFCTVWGLYLVSNSCKLYGKGSTFLDS